MKKKNLEVNKRQNLIKKKTIKQLKKIRQNIKQQKVDNIIIKQEQHPIKKKNINKVRIKINK